MDGFAIHCGMVSKYFAPEPCEAWGFLFPSTSVPLHYQNMNYSDKKRECPT